MSQEQFFDETVIWDRTPPQLYIKYSVYVWGGSWVPNLQTEFNYPDLFKSYCIFSDLLSPEPRVVSTSSPHRLQRQCGPCSPHHPRCPRVIPASSPLSPKAELPNLNQYYTWRHACVVPVVPASSPHRARRLRVARIAPRGSPHI